VDKVGFFHNPQVASLLSGMPVNCLETLNLFKTVHR